MCITYQYKISHLQSACPHKKPHESILNNTFAHCSSPELTGLPLMKTPGSSTITLHSYKVVFIIKKTYAHA